MYKLIKCFWAAIPVLLIGYLEWDYMSHRMLVEFSTSSYSSTSSIVQILLFLICTVFCFKNKSKIMVQEKYLLFSYMGIFLFTFSYAFSQSQILPVKILLPVVAFFYASRYSETYGYDSALKISLLLLFLFLVYTNFTTRELIYASMLTTDQFISSASYVLLFMLPLILIYDNKYVRWGGMLVIVISILMSFKRTGLISLVLGILVYFIIFMKLNKLRFSSKLITIIAVCAVGFYVTANYLDAFFIERLISSSEDGGSGRDLVYHNAIQLIQMSDLEGLLFGHGWDTVTVATGMPAHNDYLELIYDCGIFVLILFVLFLLRMLLLTVKLYKKQHSLTAPLAASLAIFLVNTMISHVVLYIVWMLIFALFWGIVVGLLKREKIIV